jgi:hypothetical protein
MPDGFEVHLATRSRGVETPQLVPLSGDSDDAENVEKQLRDVVRDVLESAAWRGSFVLGAVDGVPSGKTRRPQLAVVEDYAFLHKGGGKGEEPIRDAAQAGRFAEMVRCTYGLEPLRPSRNLWRRTILNLPPKTPGSVAEKYAIRVAPALVTGWMDLGPSVRGHVAEAACLGVYGLRLQRFPGQPVGGRPRRRTKGPRRRA